MEESLGQIVSWDFDAHDYPITSIKSALAYAELPEDLISSLDMRRAFRRAARKIAHNNAVDKLPGNDTNKVSFQFTARKIGEDRVTYEYSSRVILDCDTGVVWSDDAEVQVQAAAALASCTDNRTAGDLNKAVKRMMESNGEIYAINPIKGVAYFVPAKHAACADKLGRFTTALSGGRWFIFVVPKNDERTTNSVTQAIEHGLREEISAMAKAVDAFDDSTRAGTMNKFIEQFQRAEHKVEGYAAFLKDKAQELLTKLEEERALLVKKITEKAESEKVDE